MLMVMEGAVKYGAMMTMVTMTDDMLLMMVLWRWRPRRDDVDNDEDACDDEGFVESWPCPICRSSLPAALCGLCAQALGDVRTLSAVQ